MKKFIELKCKAAIYTVKGSNMKVKNDGFTISFDDVVILKNGECESAFGENFAGMTFSAEDVASELIRAYVNGNPDVSVRKVCDSSIRKLKDEYSKEKVITAGVSRNKRYLGVYNDLSLQMISDDGFAFYTDGDEYIMLRPDGTIATDYEFFYENEYEAVMENDAYAYLLEVEKVGKE